MGLIEIDVIGLQTTQRVLYCLQDVQARKTGVVRCVSHAAAHLGGDHQPVARFAPLAYPSADDGLGYAAGISLYPARIDIGGIDEIDAGFYCRIQNFKRQLLICRPPELHAAHAQRRDFQAGLSPITVLHFRPPDDGMIIRVTPDSNRQVDCSGWDRARCRLTYNETTPPSAG